VRATTGVALTPFFATIVAGSTKPATKDLEFRTI
jgi:hypothetical protein